MPHKIGENLAYEEGREEGADLIDRRKGQDRRLLTGTGLMAITIAACCVGGAVVYKFKDDIDSAFWRFTGNVPVSTPVSPTFLPTLTPIAELPKAPNTLAPVATPVFRVTPEIGQVPMPTAGPTSPDTLAANPSVDAAVKNIGIAGVTNREQFLKFFKITGIDLRDIRIPAGEEQAAQGVEIPVKKLPNGQVRQFGMTNPLDRPVEGYICGNTNQAAIPAHAQVCAESLVVRNPNAKPEPTAPAKSGDPVDAAIQGMKVPGINTRQDLANWLGLHDGATAGDFELCPGATPETYEPNCVQIPVRRTRTGEIIPFWTNYSYSPYKKPAGLTDGYRCPFKTEDGKWADNRQRQGVPPGNTCDETIVVRWDDFHGGRSK